MTFLVRPRAWWYNKLPLSVMLLLLLADGKILSTLWLAAMCGLVACVCAVANSGYAINELFDRDEDLRAGRSNTAATAGARRMWVIIAASATVALALAALLAGRAGLLLAGAALVLPCAYSIPPLRLKERGWPGICADAAAAHVFPAMLALLIVTSLGLRAVSPALALLVVVWSAATGLRGILSHQLQSEQSDHAAGLRTVVHRFGHARIRALVVRLILPLETLAFAGVIACAGVGRTAAVGCALYLAYECLKWRINPFPVRVFDAAGEPYLPFVDEGHYKVWAPITLALDAAGTDPFYLGLALLHALLFRPRVRWEWQQLRTALPMAATRWRHTNTQSGTGEK